MKKMFFTFTIILLVMFSCSNKTDVKFMGQSHCCPLKIAKRSLK